MEGTVVSEDAAIIRVAVICGSLRRGSLNRGLIRYAQNLCEEDISGMQIELVDIGSLPLLNTDLEIDGGYPPAVEAYRRIILEADSSFEERNRLGISASKCVGRKNCRSCHKPPKKFDSDGNLIDSEIKQRLKELLLSLQSFTLRHKRGLEKIQFPRSKCLFVLALITA